MPQIAQFRDNLLLDLTGLVCFENGLLVMIPKNLGTFQNPILGQECVGWYGDVVDDVGDFERSFRAVFV